MRYERSWRSVVSAGLLVVVWSWAASPLYAEVKLPHVIGNHMVLQRDQPIPVWGWADADEAVTVELNTHKATTRADSDGKWNVRLPSMSAGGPFEMVVSGKNTIRLTDILIGEVWICSGQSNMEMGINSVNSTKEEVAGAKYPEIRLFQLGWKTSAHPLPDVDASWRVCSPKTIAEGGWFNAGFSAVAYFFGREIHTKVNVPVGLIDSNTRPSGRFLT